MRKHQRQFIKYTIGASIGTQTKLCCSTTTHIKTYQHKKSIKTLEKPLKNQNPEPKNGGKGNRRLTVLPEQGSEFGEALIEQNKGVRWRTAVVGRRRRRRREEEFRRVKQDAHGGNGSNWKIFWRKIGIWLAIGSSIVKVKELPETDWIFKANCA